MKPLSLLIGWLLRPKAAAALLALFALLAVGLTTWPLDFDLGGQAIRDKWAQTEWEVFYFDEAGEVVIDADLILNVLFFLPLGALWALMRRPSRWWRAGIEALLVGCALSALVEGLQVLTPGRTTQLADLWRNTLGSGIGGAVVGALRPRLEGLAAQSPSASSSGSAEGSDSANPRRTV